MKQHVIKDYSTYHSSLTQRYKQGYIHSACVDNTEIFKVSVDSHAYMIYVKSIHAAKIAITKHTNKMRG